VVVDDHPEIFPMNHAFDPATGEIAFPSRAATKLRAALAAEWVAYEVDGIDPEDGSGWSVMVIGRAEELTDRHAIERMVRLRKARWAVSEQSHWLIIRPARITGRLISHRFDAEA
jgi:nitroimidazol reductase NimA-like FMN-containing flavoprotein (pyridoxamine 5'-phosphate oxidase superfamily)